MPSLISRPFATIEAPSHVPRSRRFAEVDSPGLLRGCTARNSSGKKKKQKIELDNNPYYKTIIK